MSSSLGLGLSYLGLLICAFGAPVGFAAGAYRSPRGLKLVRVMALAFAGTMLAATLVMWYALITHDFSVSYVAQVGSLSTPLHITIVSLWSSLEGSILFWGLVLGLYTGAVAILQRRGHEEYLAYTLATLLLIGVFFTYLIAGAANPFKPVEGPIPTDGPGPNALLQNHWLMIWHPPTLYLGYVGMAVPFAMAVAALLRGQLGATWLQPLRKWLLVPTGFLTLGIMLGGWWSYEVLGWGGYWAWDPVENASFLPWLTAIAAVHSALVLQRRGSLKAWTVVLIVISFLLTILGTFLTRSGVVNSVHSFTQSPIGPLFLYFLGACLIAMVVLLALRIDTITSEQSTPGIWNREGAILVNNLLLVAVMFTTLVGTLYPILAEALRGDKVSVGEPFFNRMAVPILMALILLIGLGPALPWGQRDRAALRKTLLTPLPFAAGLVVVSLLFGFREPSLLFCAAIFGYSLWITIAQLTSPARRRAASAVQVPAEVVATTRLAPRRAGAYLAHLGILVTFAAIAISSTLQSESQGRLQPGDRLSVEGYDLRFEQVELVREPHVTKQEASVTVGNALRLRPSLNFYATMREPIVTPAVRTNVHEDLYLTLTKVWEDGSIGLRAIVTPAVVWIWIGIFVTVVGTGLCLVPTRRRATAETAAP